MSESPIRVLFEGDEPKASTVPKDVLEQLLDVPVDMAHFTAEGLQAVVQNRYDVTVSNYQIPETGGVEQVRHPQCRPSVDSFEVGMPQDTSGHGDVNRSLKEKAELHRLVFETLAEGLVVRDSEGKLILCNDEAANIFGLPSADQLMIRGISASDTMLEDGTPCSHEDMPTTITFRTGKPLTNILRGIKIGDGPVKWVLVNTRPNLVGEKITAVVVSINDVTSKLHAEKELQDSERRFRLIAENMSDVIAVIDMDLQHVYVSPSCVKLRGFTAEEVMVQSLKDIFVPDSLRTALGVFREEMEADGKEGVDLDRVRYMELEEYCKDGSTKWIGNSIRPIRGADGKPISIIILSRDVTELRASIQALHEANGKLAMLSRLTRHDIMNQLQVVGGWLELMHLEDSKNIVMRDKMLKALVTTKSLIDFSAEYENIGSVTPSFIEVGREVEAIARSVPSDLIKIHNDLGQGKVLADPLFHKVVYNIVENAVRHGGGATHIRFRSEVDGRCLKIICEDDGMGLTEEDKEQIFARGVGKNTGEGLFLIRHILSMTGMTIREEGRPDEGARFVITVPEGHWQK